MPCRTPAAESAFRVPNNTTIGGSEAGERNVISGNASGIAMNGGADVVIHGNYIGTDITGTKALGNAMGINDSGMDNVAIGGSGPGEGNLVSGNKGIGIYVYNFATDTTILGNRIGTDVTGTLPLGNIIGIATSNDSGGSPDRRNGAGGSQRHRLQQGIPRLRPPRRRPGLQLEQTDSDPRQLVLTTTRASVSRSMAGPPQRSARRRHRVQRSAELPDRPFGRIREFHDPGPRQVQQRRLDDVHARLLREPSLPEVPARVPRRRDLSRRLGDHDRRGRARRRRRHAARGRGERGAHLRHGDGPRREHLRVLAADHLLDDAVVGPRGRRPASADLRHGLRRAGRADHRRRRGGLHVPERPPAVRAFAAASGRHGQRRRRDDAGRDDGNPREGMGL